MVIYYFFGISRVDDEEVIRNRGNEMKVGDLVNFFVVKAIPDYDSYLTCVLGGEILALLPKRFAGRTYKVGESGWAAVFEIHAGGRVIISRTSPQFIRRYLEFSIRDFLLENEVTLKRTAKVSEATFHKVSCDTTLTQADLYERFQKALPKDFREEIGGAIIPVKFSEAPDEYAVNALFPAPMDKVRRVYYYSEMEIVTVYVDMKVVGRFTGKRGCNVATAAKLIGIEIELKGL